MLRAHDGPVKAVALLRPDRDSPPVLATAGDGAQLRLWRLPAAEGGEEPTAPRELLALNLEHDINCLLAVDHRLLVGTKDGVAALAFSAKHLRGAEQGGPGTPS